MLAALLHPDLNFFVENNEWFLNSVILAETVNTNTGSACHEDITEVEPSHTQKRKGHACWPVKQKGARPSVTYWTLSDYYEVLAYFLFTSADKKENFARKKQSWQKLTIVWLAEILF